MADVKFKLGRDEFVATEMTLGQLEQALPIIAEMRSGGIGDQIGRLIDIVEIACERHDVRSLKASLPQLQAAVTAILTASGFAPVSPGEAKAGKTSTSRRSAKG